MTYKSMYKYELAMAAGVSTDTFRRWLQSGQSRLRQHQGRQLQRLDTPHHPRTHFPPQRHI